MCVCVSHHIPLIPHSPSHAHTHTHIDDRLLDAWRGACTWANAAGNSRHFITRAEYAERGAEYFKEHVASNLVITPIN